MFVYKWTVSDVVKGTALVKQIGDCTVRDKGESMWILICELCSICLYTNSNLLNKCSLGQGDDFNVTSLFV